MIVLYNPAAGRRRSHFLWRVLDVLSSHGVRHDLIATAWRGHATELARAAAREAQSMVVAAGGDGTIAEVAAGLIGSETRLGIIPLGTANVLAHELGLPRDARALAAVLAFGRTRPLWPGLALAPDRVQPFVQMCGAGLDAQVVHRLSLPLKRAIGRGSYVWQTLRESARYDYPPIRIVVDGTQTTANSVIVSKGRLYGGNYLLAPQARTDEPGFCVALFTAGGTAASLGYGAALPLNLLPRMPGMTLIHARRVGILGPEGVSVQTDGDPAGFTPLEIVDTPAPLAVVIAG